MASPELERSSSSPSVRIAELKREGADGSVLRVRLDDGSLFLLDADDPAAAVVRSLRDSGDSIDEETVEALSKAAESYRCRRKALSLLARAEQCRNGLDSKLTRKGFSRNAVVEVLDRLEGAGLLDDRRFAEAWTRSRLRSRPEGSTKLIASLMAKGVPGKIAGDAVESVFREAGEGAEEDALKRAMVKLSRRTGVDDEKLTAALVRRGFSYSAVRNQIMLKHRTDDSV